GRWDAPGSTSVSWASVPRRSATCTRWYPTRMPPRSSRRPGKAVSGTSTPRRTTGWAWPSGGWARFSPATRAGSSPSPPRWVGSKQVQILQRFVTETEIDTIMLAGRYTLLEQPALDELLPACEKHGVSVLNVGVFNSGLLARDWPADDGHYEYGTAPRELVERARRIAAVCREHGTTLPHAALVFAGAHPTVASVVVGAGRPAHRQRNADLAAAPPPPAALWADLVAQGLLRPDA